MSWFRLWHDMPTDPRLRVVSRKSGRPLCEVVAVYLCILAHASASPARGRLTGYRDEDAAAALDLDEEAVAAIREAMQGRLLDGDRVIDWDARQPKRDDPGAAARKRRQRARARDDVTPCHADVTPCHADVTPQREIEREKIDSPPSSSLRSDDDPPTPKTTPREALLAVLDAERADAVIEHRKRLRKPLTARAARLLARNLARCRDPAEAADTMIVRGWLSVEAEWMERQNERAGKVGGRSRYAEFLRAGGCPAEDDGPAEREPVRRDGAEPVRGALGAV